MKAAFRIPTLFGAIALMACVGMPSVASAAITYGFQVIPDAESNAVNAAAGETQLFVDVIDVVGESAPPNQVIFRFRNVGPAAMSITDIYFDDGAIMGLSSVAADSGTGVSFSTTADPGNLPRGANINFVTTAGFSADSDPPVAAMGINPGEWLDVLVNLHNLPVALTYADVIASINLGLANPGVSYEGGLRIGIHVQAFADGGSESFVNGGVVDPTPTPIVPEPGTMAMWALGLALCGSARMWRKRRSNAA